MGRVTIVGGGIAGISVALAMLRDGWTVTLCEQAPAFAASGAGLTIAPSARAGLRFLGLEAAFEQKAEMSFPPVILDWASGAAMAPPDIDHRHLGQTRRLLRSDLHALLVDALPRDGSCQMRFGARVVDVDEGDRAVAAILADGSRIESDLLLGADGIKSRVRRYVIGDETPRFTGYVAWRFMLPAEIAVPLLRGRAVTITCGADATLTCYTIGKGRLVNCVAIVRSEGWGEEGWSIPGDPAELAAHFATAHPDARAIVAAAAEGALFTWALFDRAPARGWTRGRVALLGDAVHPVLPFLGLGAGLAIEDAVILARSLSAYPRADAFRRYETGRAPRAALIQRMSADQGDAFARIGVERTVGTAPFFDRSLFDYDPSTVPL
ncbi:MAG: FAD-dependent oxidoreductase [Janthinobacterium lividum]